jgi:5-methylcytosine-specific restriction protein A
MAERLRGRQAVEQRRRRMMRTDWLCERCRAKGKLTPATVVDHIVPLARGGSDEDANTRNLCDDWHRDATAEQFGHRKRVRVGLSGWPKED